MLEDGTLLSGGGTEIKAWDSMNYFKRVKERTVYKFVFLHVFSVASLLLLTVRGATVTKICLFEY